MKLLSILLLFIFPLPATAEELLLIVGSPTATSLTDNQCWDQGRVDDEEGIVEICMNSEWSVIYNVIEVIHGSFKGTQVEALDYYHYSGVPDHLIISPACILLLKRDDHWVRYLTEPVLTNEDHTKVFCKEGLVEEYGT